MPILIADYQAVQTLSVTGLASLANNGSVLSTAQTSADWADTLIRVQFTTSAGAAANGTVTVAVRTSIDGTDFDDAENERVLATVTFPSSGAQTRTATFLLAGAEVLPPFWMLSFRNATGDVLAGATVKTCGVRTQTASEALPVFEDVSIPVPDANAWYVATTGSDTAAGTIGAPFLTVSKAVDSAIASGTRKTIFVRGGTYRFTNHIYLAGSAANLNIFGYPNETAILSGAEVVTGFTSDGNGLYSATVPGGATSLDLAIGNKRQNCAQSGVLDPADPWHTGWLPCDSVTTPSVTQFKYRNTDIPNTVTATGVIANVPGGFPTDGTRFSNISIVQNVTAIDHGTKTITINAEDGADAIATGTPFRLLNHPDFIRNAGDFAWRSTTSRLVVKPASADFETLGVQVPRLQNFFQLDAGANNITLANLTFAHNRTGYSTIMLYGAQGLRIGNCQFVCCGIGIEITNNNSSHNTTIAGCTFRELTGDAIYVGTGVLGTSIYANTFHDIGTLGYGSAMYSAASGNTQVAYNNVFGTGQYAFSFKGAPATNHTYFRCNYNFIVRTNRRAYDTGAVEFLNRDRLDLKGTVKGNYMYDSGGWGLSSAGVITDPFRASIVYLDDLSAGVAVTGNFMRSATWGQVFIHGGDNNTISNNIHYIEATDTLVSTMHANGQPFLQGGDITPTGNQFTKNVYYSPTVRTGVQMWNLAAIGAGNVIDQNVYYNMDKLGANPDTQSTNDVNFDVNSIIADPLFVDAGANDFTFQGNSPVFAKGITNLEWNRMGRNGYTYANAIADSLPRFWQSWSLAPAVELDYVTHPGLHGIETFSRPSAATYFNQRGLLRTASGNQPRFDFDPATQEPRGLLLEPATTNLLGNSSDITNGAWTKADGATVATGQGTGLDGTNSLQSVAKVTGAGNAGVMGNGKLSTFINTFPQNSKLTASAYLKKGTLNWAYLTIWDGAFSTAKAAWFNLDAGTIGTVESGGTAISGASATMTHMGRGIYRCTLTVQTGTASTPENAITTGQFQISGDVGDTAFWGTLGGTILFGGAQVEAQAAATSLVITTNGIASRAAETLDIPLTSGSYDVAVTDSAGSEMLTGRNPSGGLYRVTPRTGQTRISKVQVYYAGTSFFLPALQAGAFTTKAGDGTTSLDTTANSMTIAFGTTATSLRAAYGPLQVGQRYRVAWSVSNSNGTQGQAGFGTSIGGPQYQPTLAGVTGANTFDFDAVSDTLYPTFQRASSGSSTFSALSVTRIAPVTWQAISPQPITPSTWTALSSGVTVNGTTGTITIAATGTLISAAGSITTTIGKRYRLVFTVGGNTIAAPIGTAQGGSTLKVSTVTHAVGSNTYEFIATTTTTWIQFQRQTSGTATVSGISLQEIIA